MSTFPATLYPELLDVVVEEIQLSINESFEALDVIDPCLINQVVFDRFDYDLSAAECAQLSFDVRDDLHNQMADHREALRS